MRRNALVATLAVALLFNLLLFAPVPLGVKSLATLLVAGLIPGALLVEWLVGRCEAAPPLWERALYAIGAAYGVLVVGMLLLSYLPGPLERWQPLVAFNGLSLLLLALVVRSNAPTLQRSNAPTLPRSPWLLAGLLSLLLVGGFFRLAGLGYAEYQGDEARAVERAAAVIQGSEDVLLIHKKGPTEILLPTAVFSLAGRLTEQAARLPFALANLAALFALFALGWRLFGPIAGWAAAMLLALDGYFIGFAHIVQYQSVIFLTTLLVVLIMHRLSEKPAAASRFLTLAALFLVTGFLSHYEGVWTLIPAAYGLWLLWRRHLTLAQLGRALALPFAVGAAIFASFYVPFVLHPNFLATLTYLTERRIGGSFPYNNLADFFIRTTLYSTTYYTLLLIALLVAALLGAFVRGLGRVGLALGGLTVGALLLTAWSPGWLTIGETDLIVLLFGLAMVAVWLAPRQRHAERLLWLWFGIPMLIALFFTEKPRTHVYVFFLPWALLAGMVVQAGWQWLRGRAGTRLATATGVSLASLAVVGFGSYAYFYFVYNQVEVLRTWDQNRPPGFWTVYDEPDNKALFGFPVANGWKVVGALYEQGVIVGDYETNEKEAWVPYWYTRGERRCARTAEWFFEIDNLEPWDQADQLAMEHYLRQGFQRWGHVEVNGAPRLVIYRRSDEPVEPQRFRLSEWEPRFDAIATADFPLAYPVVAPPEIAHPLHVNLGNEIWLEGYDIEYQAPLDPGDTFKLTLYWRAQQPITRSYKVFNQVYFGDSGIQAQLDGYPVCDGRETWRWDPGELIEDTYHIQVRPDATPGLYPLYSGMYIEETGERLPILDESGAPIETQVHVTDVRIGEE